jgi:putative transposase
MTTQPIWPEVIVTNRHPSYAHALKILGLEHLHHGGRRRENNRAENSHLPIRRRERKMQGFKSQAPAQQFLTTHAAVYNTYNAQRYLTSCRALRNFRTEAFRASSRATCA